MSSPNIKDLSLRDRWNNSRGFTLVEVIISLILSTAVAGLLATAWWQIAQLHRRDKTPSLSHLEEVQRLEQFLHAAIPEPTYSKSSLPSCRLLNNEEGSKLLIQVAPTHLQIPDVLLSQSLMILESRADQGLNMALYCATLKTPLHTNVDSNDPVLTHVFFKNMTDIQIEVLGSDNQWYCQWKAPEQFGLPRAIRFSTHPPVMVSLDHLEQVINRNRL